MMRRRLHTLVLRITTLWPWAAEAKLKVWNLGNARGFSGFLIINWLSFFVPLLVWDQTVMQINQSGSSMSQKSSVRRSTTSPQLGQEHGSGRTAAPPPWRGQTPSEQCFRTFGFKWEFPSLPQTLLTINFPFHFIRLFSRFVSPGLITHIDPPFSTASVAPSFSLSPFSSLKSATTIWDF